MSPRRAMLGHDARVFASALLAGLPGVVVSLALLWGGEHPLKVQLTLTILIASVWLGFSLGVSDEVVRPLQTMANLLSALREGDFSIRARREGVGEALGTALDEINAIGQTMRDQRLGALEALGLLGTVIHEVDVAIFAFDQDRRLRLINRAGERLLGYDPDRLLGETADALRMAPLLGGEAPRTLDIALPGARGPWELRRATFRQHGVPHELVVLTDLKRALREEERQAWQRIVRVLGHEINNSLAPIRSIAVELRHVLRREPRPRDWDTDIEAGLNVVERRAEALARFMTAYACLAKLPAPVVAPLDVETWIRRVADLDKRVRVVVEAGPPLFVLGDSDQLDQLLINLVRNAVDAALETAGMVALTWKRAQGYAEIVVTDDGPGIAQASNLFVPFFTTKPGGSGIGLVLSRQIAEAHLGALELVDRGQPQGCQAVLRLPIGSPNEARAYRSAFSK
jgi:two-component system nitrogen regulation sensor histidine kinase NtrY